MEVASADKKQTTGGDNTLSLGFLGTQFITLDAKGRLAVPARHRDALDGKVVVTIDTEARCLVLYPLARWREVAEKVQALPSMNPQIKRFQRLFFGYASDLELDGNGRILLPAPLRDYAGLGKQVVLVGQGQKFELWSDELWAAEAGDQALAGLEKPQELTSLVI